MYYCITQIQSCQVFSCYNNDSPWQIPKNPPKQSRKLSPPTPLSLNQWHPLHSNDHPEPTLAKLMVTHSQPSQYLCGWSVAMILNRLRSRLSISRETLTISRRTYWIAIFGFFAAVAAAAFVGVQVEEMSYQTQILGSQSESAAAGAAIGELNTRKQLGIAQQQAKAAQDSVKAIQRSTQQDQRPWIEFDIVDPKTVDPKTTPVTRWNLKDGERLTAPARFTNIGKTPAQHVEVFPLIEVVPHGKDPQLICSFGPKTAVRYLNKTQTVVTRGAFGTIFPYRSITDTIERLKMENGKVVKGVLTKDEAIAIFKGDAYLAFFGMVRYLDGFGIHHWTRFCRDSFATGEHADSDKCNNYNSVDNN